MRQGIARWVLFAGLCVVAGLWLLLTHGQPPGPEVPGKLSPLVSRASLEPGSGENSGASLVNGGDRVTGAERAAMEPGGSPPTQELPMESTVEGLDVDGGIRLDHNGNLVLDRHLRRFLDFFIGLTQSREDEPALKRRIQALMVREGVPEAVREQVQGILADYLDYREAAEQLASQEEQDLEQAFDRLYSLRRDWLGPDVARGFFAEDEARIQRALDRHRIMSDKHLSEQERERALLQLEQSLPESSRERLQQSRRLHEVSQRVAEMRQQGAGEEAIRQLRARELGPEAAERLARVDARRQQWQQKLSRYQAQREQIESAQGLSPEDRQQAIRELRQKHFKTDYERRRARALEQAGEYQAQAGSD